MANLYEIEQALLDCIDTETGEILDFSAFEQLLMEKDTKIEQMALWVKNLNSDAEAFKKEKEVFADKEKAAKAKVESLKKYLDMVLQGNKFSTPKVQITYRKSVSTEVDNEFIEWAQKNNCDLLKIKEPEPNKTAIKELITSGTDVPFARVLENSNIQIK